MFLRSNHHRTVGKEIVGNRPRFGEVKSPFRLWMGTSPHIFPEETNLQTAIYVLHCFATKFASDFSILPDS